MSTNILENVIDRSLPSHTSRPSLGDLPSLPSTAWQVCTANYSPRVGTQKLNNIKTVRDINIKI